MKIDVATIIAVMVLLVGLATGAEPVATPQEWPSLGSGMKLGDIGKFRQDKPGLWFEVVDVIGPSEMLVKGIMATRSATGQSTTTLDITPFIVTGVPTKGLIDESKVKLDGLYKVADTKKHRSKTCFVVKLLNQKETQAILDAKQQAAQKADNEVRELRLAAKKVAAEEEAARQLAKQERKAAAEAKAQRVAEEEAAANSPEGKAAKELRAAELLLRQARLAANGGDRDGEAVWRKKAAEALEAIIRKWPDTNAAKESRTLLRSKP